MTRAHEMTPSSRLAAHSLNLATLPPMALVVAKFAQVLAAWETRRRTRAGLSQLDAHMLRDIGVTEATRTTEVNKPFWRD